MGGVSMLEKLLRLISERGVYHPAELARQLGVSEGLVRLMAADLVKKGYLQPVENSETGQCGDCSLADGCKSWRPRMYVLK